MSFLFLTGRYFNLLSRPSATLTATPAATSYGPVTALGDSDPSSPCVHGSAAASSEIRYEGLAVNGGFESDLTGWTSVDAGGGASTITTTAGEFRTGTKGLKCVLGAGTVTGRYQDIIVAAGESVYFSSYMRAPTGVDIAEVYIANLTTGYYLDSFGNWVPGSHLSGPAFSATNTSASFVQKTRTLSIQSFQTSRADYHVIRVEFQGTGTVYFDDIQFLPGVTFASIHGHNLGAMMAPVVQSSDDASSWTTRGTMTVKRGAFFVTFANVYARYWRFLYDGGNAYENATPPYIGEAVLGQYQTSATSPQWGIPKTRAFPGVRTRSPGAKHHVYNFATDPPEDIEATFSARTAAAASEIADSIWLRSAQGQNPTIFVPIDTESDVFYGRLIEPITVQRPFSGVYDTTLRMMGDPFPTTGL